MLGMHGTYESNMAMNQADLIVAIGARFDDGVEQITKAPHRIGWRRGCEQLIAMPGGIQRLQTAIPAIEDIALGPPRRCRWRYERADRQPRLGIDFLRDEAGLLGAYAVLAGAHDYVKPNYSLDALHLTDAGYAALNEALRNILTEAP
jgi:thiamine pyrophosphate-dependent acetolactate synthase large subunit-like protein